MSLLREKSLINLASISSRSTPSASALALAALKMRSPLTAAGLIQFTRILYSPTSMARVSVKAMTPILDTQYGLLMGKPDIPPTELIFIILPLFRRIIAFNTSLEQSIEPVRFVASTSFHFCSSISTILAVGPGMPALLTKISILPYSART